MRSPIKRLISAGALSLTALALVGASANPTGVDGRIKLGKSYRVGGDTYTPADDPVYDAVGYASWYGNELAGRRTANGEMFMPSGISAAHRTLPMPSYVEVTALSTGRTILVRINDRGPFSASRLIDLSRGAAEQLGIIGRGPSPVRIRRVEPTEEERAALRAGQRAAERIPVSGEDLERFREQLAR